MIEIKINRNSKRAKHAGKMIQTNRTEKHVFAFPRRKTERKKVKYQKINLT